MAQQSHLESLPIELLHHITSYLLPSHAPNRSVLDNEPHSSLIDLASCSRTFKDVVESYCRTTLLQWSDITRFKGAMPKSKRAKTTHRGILLKWKKTHCVFCGKKSVRKAVLCTGLGCCAECDRVQWTDKIVRNSLIRKIRFGKVCTDCSEQTKTNAKKDYHLTEDHLFADADEGLPVINYGSYVVDGGVATMFLRSDVERLATAVHGDWKSHMKERHLKAEERRRKLLEEKEKSEFSHKSAIRTGIDADHHLKDCSAPVSASLKMMTKMTTMTMTTHGWQPLSWTW